MTTPCFETACGRCWPPISDVEVVGEASSGKEALRLSVEHQPDVILMDIQMPDLNGIEATRQILRVSPHVGIIMLTMFQDDDSVFAVMRAGARGYVLKGADQAVLLRAVRAVANGESLFSPEIAARLMQFFANLEPASRPELFPELTAARARNPVLYCRRADEC